MCEMGFVNLRINMLDWRMLISSIYKLYVPLNSILLKFKLT